MTATYAILRDDLDPPAKDSELALFTCMLQSPVARESLATLGLQLPDRFFITHNTGADDPPDLHALGLGWECTEFPPNQSALRQVHSERAEQGMVVPGYSQTGSDIRKIRQHADYAGAESSFFGLNDEIVALEDAFLNKVIGGSKSKDLHGNHVLLLDQRQDDRSDIAETAIRRALQKQQPKFIKLILLVGWKRREVGDKTPIPRVAQMYP